MKLQIQVARVRLIIFHFSNLLLIFKGKYIIIFT